MTTRSSLPVVGGAPLDPALAAVVADVTRAEARAALSEGTEEAVVAASEQAANRALRMAAGELARRPPPRPIACGPRCPSCCHAKVIVFAPESLRLAAHLRSTLAPEALAELRARVAAMDATTHGTTRRERAALRLACPLLDAEGSCGVHPARPLHCIGWASLDVAACARSLEDPSAESAPVYAPQHDLAGAAMGGLALACRDEGKDAAPLELVAALRVALEHDDAAARWLRGEPVFEAAHDEELLARLANGSGGA